MDVRYVLEILFVIHSFSSINIKPVESKTTTIDDWAKKFWNNASKPPTVKYAQLFNVAAHGYIKITNTTIDATTTNDKDPDTYLQIDMFGRSLMAIRSQRTGKYICHNNATGVVEIKVVTNISKNRGCLFVKTQNNSKKFSNTISYESALKKAKSWYLAFSGKGKNKGQPRRGDKTHKDNNHSRYLETSLPRSRLRKKR